MLVIQNGNEKFNFRVAALIFNDENDKILIHRKKGYNFWMLLGGRMEMGEDTEIGIKRELEEELKIKEDVQIKLIIEDFFKLEDVRYHELCFYYSLNINVDKYDLNYTDEFNGVEGENYIFKWVPINELSSYDLKPKFIKDKIKTISNLKGLEHIIINER